jgi:uncharacterized protein YdeI (YjbR/CyaY-like superfamily)
MKQKAAQDLPIMGFESQKSWEAWLARNQGKSSGIWLRFFKKDSGVSTVSYPEALDIALCYGWIDGQLAKHDEKSWLRKFTPRRPRSIWSKRNIQHVERLRGERRMQPAGLEEVERAKADGRWGKAYDSSSEMMMPEDFLALLSKNRKASAFFEMLNKTNRYSIVWRLQTAKRPDTRKRRMQAIIQMLARGETFH